MIGAKGYDDCDDNDIVVLLCRHFCHSRLISAQIQDQQTSSLRLFHCSCMRHTVSQLSRILECVSRVEPTFSFQFLHFFMQGEGSCANIHDSCYIIVMENLITIMPWVWLGVLVVLVIIEACTMALTTIWGAISALILIFLSMTGLAMKWQIMIFLILTIVLLLTTRPFAVKKLKLNKATNVSAVIGQEVVVTKAVSRFQKGEAKGRNGVIWTVTSNSEKEIPAGTICNVSSVEGNTLIVNRKGE
jgi:membrane protein implicated in regulation of membrane protease activity